MVAGGCKGAGAKRGTSEAGFQYTTSRGPVGATGIGDTDGRVSSCAFSIVRFAPPIIWLVELPGVAFRAMLVDGMTRRGFFRGGSSLWTKSVEGAVRRAGAASLSALTVVSLVSASFFTAVFFLGALALRLVLFLFVIGAVT